MATTGYYHDRDSLLQQLITMATTGYYHDRDSLLQ
jgi:hypothetical protein